MNSPIDRYYRMYVMEPESKVFKALEESQSPLGKFKHFKGCVNHSPSISPDRIPSPERQLEILKAIKKTGSIEGMIAYCDKNEDAKTVM
jgi:hypothetical protein